MYDLTMLNPTKDPFNTGSNINQACTIDIKVGVYINVGSGTINTFTSSQLLADGSYSSGSYSGSWSFSISLNSDNTTYTVVVTLTGVSVVEGYSRTFNTASCSQSSSNPNALTFQDPNSADHLVVSQDNGSPFTDGRIEFNPSWVPVVSIYADSNT